MAFKYQQMIDTMFSWFHESWMSDHDKSDMNNQLLKAIGHTLEELDEQIETGVRNGYSVEKQLSVAKYVLHEKLRSHVI